MDQYRHVLSELFGFKDFRPGQHEAIQSILEDRRHTMVVLATSTGKTLIYQFISILKHRINPKGVTVVVSPLIALMIDQVNKWNEMFHMGADGSIKPREDTDVLDTPIAVLLGSAQHDHIVEARALNGAYPVVYIAPEKIPHLSRSFIDSVHFLVIDECHCISEYGNSFRPAYRQIRQYFEHTQTLALTATATYDIQCDILTNLKLDNPRVIRMSMHRPNLRIMIQNKSTRVADTKTILSHIHSVVGRSVVFGTTRSECEALAAELGGIVYHAGMNALERADAITRFVSGTTIVATSCFGLGVDIPDIRLVVHYGLPRSLLAYVQECGRAGRDGALSTCVLLFDARDISKYCDNERDVTLATEMLSWLRDTRCRRRSLMCYFGETDCTQVGMCKWSDTINGCDRCSETNECEDPIDDDDAYLLLRAVMCTGGYTGKCLPVDYLLGSKLKKVVRYIHHPESVYNRGRHRNRTYWLSIHKGLMKSRYLKEVITSRGFVVYKITKRGVSWMDAYAK